MWAKFHDPNTKISKYGKWYAIAPLLIIFIGIVLLCIPGVGFNLGLDFTGGGIVETTNIQTAQMDAVKTAVTEALSDDGIRPELSTRDTDGVLGLTIKYQLPNDADIMDINNKIIAAIMAVNDTIEVTSSTSLDASASSDIIMMTFISIAVTLIAIMIYILFRFKFSSGMAAMIGLFHDVLVVCALMAIFRVQINYSFVAAVITMVVYSLNNTIVLFDRVRRKEKMAKELGNRQPVDQIVDASVKETFARTIATTVTTMVPVLALCCIGVPLIAQFALPIFFGLIAGSFSTIFVTTALYVRFENYRNRKNKPQKIQRQDNLVTPE